MTRRILIPASALMLTLFPQWSPGAQTPSFSKPASPPTSAASVQMDPRAWAEQCAAKEAQLITHSNSYLRFRMHAVDEKGDQVRDEIETPEGSVARLIQREGRSLTSEEDAAEKERLEYLLSNPSNFAHHIRNEEANKKMGMDLLRLMPQAMLWSYAPGQPPMPEPFGGKPGSGKPLVVLDFQPNPNWNAPSIPAATLTGLAGRIWIEPETRNMVYIDASIIKPVNVGWGVVAHLFPGGTVSVHQTRVGADRWIVDHVVEQLNLRALMVKTIHQRLVYDTSGYQSVPSMSYQQAIKLLLEGSVPPRSTISLLSSGNPPGQSRRPILLSPITLTDYTSILSAPVSAGSLKGRVPRAQRGRRTSKVDA